MPAGFDDCRKRGGRIRTIVGPRDNPRLTADEFMRVCFKDGQMFPGEKHTKTRKQVMKNAK